MGEHGEWQDCTWCGGSGGGEGPHVCPHCQGTGRERREPPTLFDCDYDPEDGTPWRE